MVSLQKDVNVIKIDVMKNQNLIAEVIDRQNHQTTQNQTVENITRSNLKIPLQTMEQLDSLEANEELKQILVCFNFFLIFNFIKVYLFFFL